MAKILLIDDDFNIYKSLMLIISTTEHKLEHAPKAKPGIERVYADKPDLILLDVQLPDMNGFDVCKILKTNPVSKEIPVIMLSGKYIEPSAKAQGLDGGADDYLTKPYNPDELIVRINNLLKISGKQ